MAQILCQGDDAVISLIEDSAILMQRVDIEFTEYNGEGIIFPLKEIYRN